MTIVRDLIGRFRWQVGTQQLDAADGKVRGLKRRTTSLAAAVGKLGLGLSAAAVARQAFKAVDESLQLGRDMGQVATLIPGATQRVEDLRNAVRELAKETGKDTSDISRGVFDVISAFGDSADTMDAVRNAAVAATAGGTSTASMFKLLAAITKGYGDTSAKAQAQAADLVFLINKLGFTDIPQLSAAMARQIPMAVATGVSQQELAAAMAALVGTTGNAAEVSTQLASLYRSMAKRTDTADKALRKMGFTSIKAAIQSKGLAGVLNGLIGQTDGTAEAILKLFGRAEAVTAALALSGTQAGKYEDSLRATKSAAGTVIEAHRAMTSGLGGAAHEADKAKVKFQVLRQEVGDLLVADVNRAKQSFLDLATAIGGQVLPSLSAYHKAREAQIAADKRADADTGGTTMESIAGEVARSMAQGGELVAHGMNLAGIQAARVAAGGQARMEALRQGLTPEQAQARVDAVNRAADSAMARRSAVVMKNVRLLGMDPEQARKHALTGRLAPRVHTAAEQARTSGQTVKVEFHGTKIEVPANTTPEQASQIVASGVEKAIRSALTRAARAHPDQTEAPP